MDVNQCSCLHYIISVFQEDKRDNVRLTLIRGMFVIIIGGSQFLGSALKVALFYAYGKTHGLMEMQQIW
jgi:hypothetical protein